MWPCLLPEHQGSPGRTFPGCLKPLLCISPEEKEVNKCSGCIASQNIGAGGGFRAHLVHAPHFTGEEAELELPKVTQCDPDGAQIRAGVSSLLVHPEEGSVPNGQGLVTWW